MVMLDRLTHGCTAHSPHSMTAYSGAADGQTHAQAHSPRDKARLLFILLCVCCLLSAFCLRRVQHLLTCAAYVRCSAYSSSCGRSADACKNADSPGPGLLARCASALADPAQVGDLGFRAKATTQYAQAERPRPPRWRAGVLACRHAGVASASQSHFSPPGRCRQHSRALARRAGSLRDRGGREAHEAEGQALEPPPALSGTCCQRTMAREQARKSRGQRGRAAGSLLLP